LKIQTGNLKPKLDKLAQMTDLGALMNSNCFASFFVEKMTWRASNLIKKWPKY